jgi:hypothetical protein
MLADACFDPSHRFHRHHTHADCSIKRHLSASIPVIIFMSLEIGVILLLKRNPSLLSSFVHHDFLLALHT